MINREGRRKYINDAVLLTVYYYCCTVVLLSVKAQRTVLISFDNFPSTFPILLGSPKIWEKLLEWKLLSDKFSFPSTSLRFPSAILLQQFSFSTGPFLCKEFFFSRKTSIEFSTWAKSFWDRIFRPILLSLTSCYFLEMITKTRWNFEMEDAREGIIW